MKSLLKILLLLCPTVHCALAQSAAARIAAKPVRAHRGLLAADLPQEVRQWQVIGRGDLSVSAAPGEHAPSLRLHAEARLPEDRPPKNKRWFELVQFRRPLAGEDWRAFNRITLWIFPHLPGWRVVEAGLVLCNDGARKLPDDSNRDGRHTMMGLRNGEWNRVIWEIPHLDRDRVTAFEVILRRQGHEPDASNSLAFHIRDVELEAVPADHFEGWEVAPGRIAFSHLGYAPEGPKLALASTLAARRFQVLDQRDGKVLVDQPVVRKTTRLGTFQVLDFSRLRREGTYRLRAGAVETPPFRIVPNRWLPSVWKTLEFYAGQRCGVDVPGIHRVCHRDWMVVHGDKRLPLNGGWHDAGDLSQGTTNTAEAVSALLDLAQRLRETGLDAALEKQLTDEAVYGLEWLLKTSFHDGYRAGWATMGLWTDGEVGGVDDITAEAVKDSAISFRAATAEARAYRVMHGKRPELAARALAMAREDWRFGIKAMNLATRPESIRVEVLSAAATASLELFQATKEVAYLDSAASQGDLIVECQQPASGESVSPIAGFSMVDGARTHIFQQNHVSFYEAPVTALAALVRLLPGHAHRQRWQTALSSHAASLRRASELSEPYGILPASIYHESDHLTVPEAQQATFLSEVRAGVDLGDGYYLRFFPVWFQKRGHFPILLSRAKSLAVAGRILGDSSSREQAARQLEWVCGLNPFAQCNMYGIGYDFPTLYNGMSGNLAGALPVGIQTRHEADTPYWPDSVYPNYKEVWIHAVSKWLSVVADLLETKEEANHLVGSP